MSLSGHWFELRGWIFLRQGENPAFFVLYERTERTEAKASQIQLQRKGHQFGAKRWGSGHGLHRKGALSRKTRKAMVLRLFCPNSSSPRIAGPVRKSNTERSVGRMFKKASVPPATSKGAGGHGRKTPLQEPHGGGFRPGRRALAPTGDAGTLTIQRPCHRLDRPPSARGLFGCSRVSPAKALPVEALSPGSSEPIRELTKPPQPHSRPSFLPGDRSKKIRRSQ